MSKINILTSENRFSAAPHLYGLFFEDINRAADGGLYSEMLRNRSFEDSIPPERCVVSDDLTTFTTPLGWSDQFNNGEGMTSWLNDLPATPIPAWYTDNASISLDTSDTLNPKRLCSLKAEFSSNGTVKNTGFRGLPLKKDKKYMFYMFAKADETPAKLNIAIASASGDVYDESDFIVESGEYKRYDCTFTAVRDDNNACLVIKAPESSTVNFGFTSLMPADTYKGHGMRIDLMEMLAGTNSKFLRFPGGCIVEGFTYETAMRFPNTIGPVWERPSHLLMWHYRTTNGIGFHEYLQICEDLDLEPMYVINCGLTCQSRRGELFEGEELEAILEESLDAIEYAIGDVSTPMGKKRSEAGHPAPFKMTYIEIGNENYGPDYFVRYKKFYDVLKARYPEIIFISNTHTELQGLPTEIADEHYYNTPDFFAENVYKYDNYDRKGPEIFVGEYAVNQGTKPGTIRNALCEAIFLTGVENNQDIVTLTAYAPLFENVDYRAWGPNLIVFDNHRTYGIPTYHVLSMLAANNSGNIIRSLVDTPKRYRDASGLPGIMAAKSGMTFRNAKLNGEPASITREIQGSFKCEDDEYVSVTDPDTRKSFYRPGTEAVCDMVFAAFGDKPHKSYDFEVEVKSQPDNSVTIAVWCYEPLSYFKIDETTKDKWDIRTVRCCRWTISDSASNVWEGNFIRRISLAGDKETDIDIEKFNTFKVITREDGFDCYINEELVHNVDLPHHPGISASAYLENDVITLKIVNITSKPDNVEISFDTPVKPDYEVQLLTAADPDAANSLDEPSAVSPVTTVMTGASQNFTYHAPAYSLSVIKLKV